MWINITQFKSALLFSYCTRYCTHLVVAQFEILQTTSRTKFVAYDGTQSEANIFCSRTQVPSNISVEAHESGERGV
jgi:hypothetical protein